MILSGGCKHQTDSETEVTFHEHNLIKTVLYTMSVLVVINICYAQTTKIVKFLESADRSPPVASLEQRHNPPLLRLARRLLSNS